MMRDAGLIILFFVISASPLSSRQVSAGEPEDLKNSISMDIGFYTYPSSPYLNRASSLGLFSRRGTDSTAFGAGIAMGVWRDLAVGLSFQYVSVDIDIHTGDYAGIMTVSNNIVSLPVTYRFRFNNIVLGAGASVDWLIFRKSYHVSTAVNLDNNGAPGLSGTSSGTTLGAGVLGSLDVFVGRRFSIFVQEWYRFSPPLAGQNSFGDAFYPGGNSLSGGVRVWL